MTTRVLSSCDIQNSPGSKMTEAIARQKSHVRAWYSYAFAAEVFSAVGIVSCSNTNGNS